MSSILSFIEMTPLNSSTVHARPECVETIATGAWPVRDAACVAEPPNAVHEEKDQRNSVSVHEKSKRQSCTHRREMRKWIN